MNNKWIKVKDKRPPLNLWILGATWIRVQEVVFRGAEEGFRLADSTQFQVPITHWMELPKPPEQE